MVPPVDSNTRASPFEAKLEIGPSTERATCSTSVEDAAAEQQQQQLHQESTEAWRYRMALGRLSPEAHVTAQKPSGMTALAT
jgi:hypothetical protein